jgi:hypothetical protein
MSNLFPSLSIEDNKSNELDKIKTGPLFHSIEYELSSIVNKITNIDKLDDKEIRDIITRQHKMILDYDLFLKSQETRKQAQILFTNKRFLLNFSNVIKTLNLDRHEIICINKLAYDYYISDNNDQEISDLLYLLTNEVNEKEVMVLSGIIGLNNARILSMIHNSSFNIEDIVHRVNNFIVKCNQDINSDCIVKIFCLFYDRFTYPFIYTMMECKPSNLTAEQNRQFDRISMAILQITNSLTTQDMKKMLCDYAFILNTVKPNTTVRFALKTASAYTRILTTIENIEVVEGLKIP